MYSTKLLTFQPEHRVWIPDISTWTQGVNTWHFKPAQGVNTWHFKLAQGVNTWHFTLNTGCEYTTLQTCKSKPLYPGLQWRGPEHREWGIPGRPHAGANSASAVSISHGWPLCRSVKEQFLISERSVLEQNLFLNKITEWSHFKSIDMSPERWPSG